MVVLTLMSGSLTDSRWQQHDSEVVKCFLPPANVVCEGYLFTPVCDSVNRGACVVARGGACVVARGGVCGCSGGGMRGCSGGHAWDTMRYRDTANEWVVRILLECILVCPSTINSPPPQRPPPRFLAVSFRVIFGAFWKFFGQESFSPWITLAKACTILDCVP